MATPAPTNRSSASRPASDRCPSRDLSSRSIRVALLPTAARILREHGTRRELVGGEQPDPCVTEGRKLAHERHPWLVGVLGDDEQPARPAAEKHEVDAGQRRGVGVADRLHGRGDAPRLQVRTDLLGQASGRPRGAAVDDGGGRHRLARLGIAAGQLLADAVHLVEDGRAGQEHVRAVAGDGVDPVALGRGDRRWRSWHRHPGRRTARRGRCRPRRSPRRPARPPRPWS